MSRESRQRRRDAKKGPPKSKFRWIVPLMAVAIITTVVVWHQPRSQRQNANGIVVKPAVPVRTPQSLKELLALPAAQLERCDIGLVNLLCAEGLPGAEDLKVSECLKRLDGWAEQAKFETQRHAYRYNEHPDQFRNSPGFFG
jgi:hypothetical protein